MDVIDAALRVLSLDMTGCFMTNEKIDIQILGMIYSCSSCLHLFAVDSVGSVQLFGNGKNIPGIGGNFM